MIIYCLYSYFCDGLNMNCYEENCIKVRVKVDIMVIFFNVYLILWKWKVKNVIMICSFFCGCFFLDVM